MTNETEVRRCQAMTKTGEPCGSLAMKDADFCRGHHPDVDHVAAAYKGAETAVARGDIRERFRVDADQLYEKLIASLEDAVEAERTVWGTCGECNHRVPVQVQDVRARVAAIDLLVSLGYGKPTQRVETQPQSVQEMVDELTPEQLVKAARLLRVVKEEDVDIRSDGGNGSH